MQKRANTLPFALSCVHKLSASFITDCLLPQSICCDVSMHTSSTLKYTRLDTAPVELLHGYSVLHFHSHSTDGVD